MDPLIRCIHRWFTVLLLAGACAGHVRAQSAIVDEYQLKAVFLYNFAQFVEWPESAFSNDSAPLIIGVVGQNPFGNHLRVLVRGEFVNGHPIYVRYFKDPDQLAFCHILFIDGKDKDVFQQSMDQVKDQPVLVVTNEEDALNSGAVIRFRTENSRIRLQIYLKAARERGLSISSKLLKMATIYRPQL